MCGGIDRATLSWDEILFRFSSSSLSSPSTQQTAMIATAPALQIGSVNSCDSPRAVPISVDRGLFV